MTEHIAIPAGPPEEKGMDFEFLRQEGLEFIEKLAGHAWTHFNPADPGTAILEQLCYAITDLSHRLSFDMADILADPPGETPLKPFFTAREILPSDPLTPGDFRKIILDVDGVKNCRVEKEEYPAPEIWLDREKKTLWFQNAGDLELLSPKGLYRVWIAGKSDAPPDSKLIEEVRKRLNACRNLCEDFVKIEVMPPETIGLRGEIDLDDDTDADELAARLGAELGRFISPDVTFRTLSGMREMGVAVEDIFSGPALAHGFIHEDDLVAADRRVEIYVSDLLRIILAEEGVAGVRELILSSSKAAEFEEWALRLDPGAMPELAGPQDLFSGSGRLKFYKSGIECEVDPEKVAEIMDGFSKTRTQADQGEKDIAPPGGDYMDPGLHEPIVNLFPAHYGIGEAGLADSADPSRKAMAKQLWAYLTVFDQILSDGFAQLAGVRKLFSFESAETRTRFKGALPKASGEIFADGHDESGLQSAEEGAKARIDFLTHLAARFSEKFTDHSLLRYGGESGGNGDLKKLEKRVSDLRAFLMDYPKISAGRGAAFDYSQPKIWDTPNISGLKKRLCRLLGFGSSQRKKLSGSNEEGFHMVEHILLRPVSKALSQKKGAFLSFEEQGQKGVFDPWSFRMTFVCPDWAGRFANPAFRTLVESTLVLETPAHIDFSILWLNKDQMDGFETLYRDWLEKKAADPASAKSWEASRALLKKIFSLQPQKTGEGV
ncbi:conserved hypothetical protein [Candidatus Desulfarcum epimagneticum]|uniref:Uncharacterized protein n=1 Tax=uncultured Desulfobacteraceae bacterium TaxID=218296 RepID=A0A484HFT6_9BACT|nr:conserved hypothetical protein [uncultured Desulfobacteraceae bacterium]